MIYDSGERLYHRLLLSSQSSVLAKKVADTPDGPITQLVLDNVDVPSYDAMFSLLTTEDYKYRGNLTTLQQSRPRNDSSTSAQEDGINAFTQID